ncbi:MAG: hypothetical protein PHU22_00870 [Eubacteriales bacterium]|nr:hypothetical protein [Eubacteriales bacterium]MDD4512882.1 hypothetical protein [Eubacteriales bacterium]
MIALALIIAGTLVCMAFGLSLAKIAREADEQSEQQYQRLIDKQRDEKPAVTRREKR